MDITSYHLLQALAFDSIYGVLSWYDRAVAHMYLYNKVEKVTERAYKLTVAVAQHKLKAPEMRYKEDKILYFYEENSETWQPVESYRQWYMKTTTIIENINF
ncbi:hypothetical protein CMT52_07705 [Elizabethkingia anophelis]|nr:hypothetical protein [Elizabethkingia anophelis]